MDVNNIIRSYIARKGKSVSQVARELGTTPQNLNRKISNRSIKYRDVYEIADNLGYEIVWRNKGQHDA